jgi:hypothetical protein
MTPKETLQALRLQYGTPMTPEENGALLNEAAWVHRGEGWGVYAKPAGTNCPMPDGTLISRDILYNKFTWDGYDCLRDAEGDAEVVWNEAHALVPAKWQASIDPGTMPIPPTPIPPTPQPPTGEPLPSYTQWLGVEVPLLAAAYMASHGHPAGLTDCGHWAWRRFVERWKLSDMVKDI